MYLSVYITTFIIYFVLYSQSQNISYSSARQSLTLQHQSFCDLSFLRFKYLEPPTIQIVTKLKHTGCFVSFAGTIQNWKQNKCYTFYFHTCYFYCPWSEATQVTFGSTVGNQQPRQRFSLGHSYSLSCQYKGCLVII